MSVEEVMKKLAAEAKNDLNIDRSELAGCSSKTPVLASKWLNIHRMYKDTLRKKEYKYKKVYRDRWMYYTGKASSEDYKLMPFDHKILKSDISIFLDSDEELQEIRNSVESVKDIVTFVDGIISELNRRSFHIKNILDAIKFSNGG